MKKLLFQLDTDPYCSVFDTVVAYDGGADHVIGHANVGPDNVTPLVEGAIFTRSPKEKRHTALFIGGSNMDAGEKLFQAVQKKFFHNFRVSVMLDSNGCNTTASAGVAKLRKSGVIAGKKVVLLGGTGPVGKRVAMLCAKEKAKEIGIVSRQQSRADNVCKSLKSIYPEACFRAIAARDPDVRGKVIEDAHIVFATGASGIPLIGAEHWENNNSIEMIADANATPPLGVGGVDVMDKGALRHGKICWGAIGFGTLKLSLHRACIEQLFTRNDQLFDIEEIYALALEMA